jgi:hypothetical protein
MSEPMYDYQELEEFGTVADMVVKISEEHIRNQGSFLPFGAVLTDDGEVQIVGDGKVSDVVAGAAAQALPKIHDALRQKSRDLSLKVIAVVEDVTISIDGGENTKAIKVHLEHKSGSNSAAYLPFKKKFLRGYSFGEMMIVEAAPEVKVWQQ